MRAWGLGVGKGVAVCKVGVSRMVLASCAFCLLSSSSHGRWGGENWRWGRMMMLWARGNRLVDICMEHSTRFLQGKHTK